MSFVKKLLLSVTALALSFAVHTANYFFYTDGKIDGKGAEDFVSQAAGVNADTLEYLFPYVVIESEPEYEEPSSPPSTPSQNGDVPDNMTFSPAEFAEYEGTYLKETADAGESYFDDIVFCGDSLTYGMGIDERFLKSCDVVAWGGLGVYDFLDYAGEPVYNKTEEIITPFEMLKRLDPKTMYIMLGTNGVALLPNSEHIDYYDKMLDRLQESFPKATIVVVGIAAWGASRNTETFNGKKVDNFNMMLLQLAKEHGVYYLNFGQATRDENGNIRDELVLGDGIHWETACKELYLKYIRTHALPDKK